MRTCYVLSNVMHLSYGFEELPGDWYMVVMEEIDLQAYILYSDTGFNADIQYEFDRQQQIRASLLKCLHLLRSSGMVHGDVRGINILVSRDIPFDVKMLDFDWAGRAGVVRYPMNVNDVGVKRPTTASDGNLILAENLEMADFTIPPKW
jgi:hypothetical protein